MGEVEWAETIDNDTIKMMKMRIAENSKIPRPFIDYLNDVRNMTFYETPNYDNLISNLH